MTGPSDKPQDKFAYPISPDEIPALMEEREEWVMAVGATIKEIQDLEPETDRRVVDEIWQRRYENALRRFEWQREIVHGFDWALEVAMRARAEEAQAAQAERQTTVAESQARSAEAQTRLASSVRGATWVMAIAVIVQALVACLAWRFPVLLH